MKLDKKYKLENAVETEKHNSRPYLEHIFIQDGKAVATNGHILVYVPVEMEEGDTPGLVSSEVWKAARKVKPEKNPGMIDIKLNGRAVLANGVEMPRKTAFDDSYPAWENVIPKNDGFSFALNARLLFQLAQAMGCESVKLTLPGDGSKTRPINVEPISVYPDSESEAKGVIMPVRENS